VTNSYEQWEISNQIGTDQLHVNLDLTLATGCICGAAFKIEKIQRDKLNKSVIKTNSKEKRWYAR
jgi:hypothetical protein